MKRFVPAATYDGLLRQALALKTLADVLERQQSHSARVIEQLSGASTAEELEAERDTNQRLTHLLMAVEAHRDRLLDENMRWRAAYRPIARCSSGDRYVSLTAGLDALRMVYESTLANSENAAGVGGDQA